jgi:hypothetical protein
VATASSAAGLMPTRASSFSAFSVATAARMLVTADPLCAATR